MAVPRENLADSLCPWLKLTYLSDMCKNSTLKMTFPIGQNCLEFFLLMVIEILGWFPWRWFRLLLMSTGILSIPMMQSQVYYKESGHTDKGIHFFGHMLKSWAGFLCIDLDYCQRRLEHSLSAPSWRKLQVHVYSQEIRPADNCVQFFGHTLSSSSSSQGFFPGHAWSENFCQKCLLLLQVAEPTLWEI